MSNETHDTATDSESKPLWTTRRTALRGTGLVGLLALGVGSATAQRPAASTSAYQKQKETDNPLSSWNDGRTKQAIHTFVEKVTTPDSPDFVPPAERIAVFDNDGTLWIERPMYVQLAFTVDRIRELAPQHPEWENEQPYEAALDNDLEALAALGQKELVELLAATHAGMTTDEFEAIVTDWLETARDPRFDRHYTELAYQPMLELLSFLRANEFKTFIVSGGGVEFMRQMSEATYGIPPERVVGSSGKTRYEVRDGEPVLVKLPEVEFVNDEAGKPVGIHKFIGRRPIAAFGNSAGDREMLEWTEAGDGPRLLMLVDHDDAKREYDYSMDEGLVGEAPDESSQPTRDVATERGWVVASMKDDWKHVFPFEQADN
ncbi:Phosphoserine phosphatase [Halogranum amylolyticum]|uniref:phosphoserine phosphatase n=1 Tax=Halogranum amylolyticum TaxID=660520 RepID=A0A1H8VDE4_9EURY|nr:HAD family hydrolase [Halogranum amylolyticum]SEP12888.1 Phosphoserine phosphatase [Halogranum amylolyticum]